MNDMMNLRRCKDRNGQRSEDEELGNPFFEADCSSSNELGDYGVAGDDYEGAPVFDDDYKEAPVFNDDQFEEELMPVYDTDIEDVIEEEEGFVGKGGFGEEEENMEDFLHQCIDGAASVSYCLIQPVSWIGARYEAAGSYSHIYSNNEYHRYEEFIRLLRSNTHTTSDSFDLLSFPVKVALYDCKTKLQNLWGLVVDFQVTHKTYPLAHQNWYQHYRDEEDEWRFVFERHIHALRNFLADVMNPDNLLPLAYSFKFLVLVNGITLKKLIRNGISSVLKPKVCLSGAANIESLDCAILSINCEIKHDMSQGVMIATGCIYCGATDGKGNLVCGIYRHRLQLKIWDFTSKNMWNTHDGSGHVDMSDRGSQFVICGDIKTVRTLV
ncbi:hypothetical protein Tco_0835289 [Tanacetum coccineum]